jgi:hypothetical protein
MKSKIENYLKSLKIENYSNEELSSKIEFKFMKFHEEMKELNLDLIIQNYRNMKSIEKLSSFYSISKENRKFIFHKRLNMKIFIHKKENDLYDIYLSFNILDKNFRNQKLENQSRIEMIKIKNKYQIQERKLREEREMKIS